MSSILALAIVFNPILRILNLATIKPLKLEIARVNKYNRNRDIRDPHLFMGNHDLEKVTLWDSASTIILR